MDREEQRRALEEGYGEDGRRPDDGGRRGPDLVDLALSGDGPPLPEEPAWPGEGGGDGPNWRRLALALAALGLGVVCAVQGVRLAREGIVSLMEEIS